MRLTLLIRAAMSTQRKCNYVDYRSLARHSVVASHNLLTAQVSSLFIISMRTNVIHNFLTASATFSAKLRVNRPYETNPSVKSVNFGELQLIDSHL